METDKNKFLRQKADQIRDSVVNVSTLNKAGHIAPSLSCVDILVALYYDCMVYNPRKPLWEDRDRLIFSKAHGCYAAYAILADKGVMPEKYWQNFYTKKSPMHGCMERCTEYGFEAGCGSLGHGLPIAVGIAFGARLKSKKYHTFCIMGDGELQEGTTWEALKFALKHRLSNLTIIVDSNHLQAMDFIVNVLDRKSGDKLKRLKGFGLLPVVCPGHNVVKLARCIRSVRRSPGVVPKVVIAETTKGFGLKCMQNVPKFHFRIPSAEEMMMGKCYE